MVAPLCVGAGFLPIFAAWEWKGKKDGILNHKVGLSGVDLQLLSVLKVSSTALQPRAKLCARARHSSRGRICLHRLHCVSKILWHSLGHKLIDGFKFLPY